MPTSSARHLLVRTLLLLLASFGVAVASVSLRPPGSLISTWYPAAAFVVAVVVLAPRRQWALLAVAITLTLLAASLVGGRDLLPAVLLALSNALQALTAGLVVRGGRDEDFRLRSPESFFRLAVGCVLGALVMSAGAALTALVVGSAPGRAAETAGPSHLAAMVVILPLLLLGDLLTSERVPRLELLAQAVCFLASIAFDFVGTRPLAVGVLALPTLVWAAMRFAPVVLAVELVVLGVTTTWFTAAGRGPFSPGADGVEDPALAGARVQLYLVCAALLAVPVALAFAQRRRLVRSVLAEQQLNATTLDTTAALILVTDGEGCVLRANPVVTRLTGCPAEQVVGRPLWQAPFVGPVAGEALVAAFAAHDGSGIPRHIELDLRDGDGDWRRVVWDNSPVLDASGRMSEVVFTGMDLTSERAASGMLRHLLEAPVPTALVGLDAHGVVSLFSHGAQQMLGWDPDQVLGRRVTDLVESGEPTEFLAHVESRRGPGGHVDVDDVQPRTSDWKWRSAPGEPLVVATTISVVLDQDAEPVGYLCVGRDVTEQRRTQLMLERTLQRERDAMERQRRLDAMKDEFVSTVSHELRTPTTNIVGYTEMLLDGDVGEADPAHTPMLEAIARNGRRLIRLAADLLVLSRLDSHPPAGADHESVDLGAVLRRAGDTARARAGERDLSLSVEVPERPVTVHGDTDHLERVVDNLLSNAVKFTPDGGTVECRLWTEEPWALVEVRDSGIGIPAEEQERLFTRFFRSTSAQERAIQGTGLGLSIIHGIVQAHGGTIDVRSAHLEGATFTVRLPLA